MLRISIICMSLPDSLVSYVVAAQRPLQSTVGEQLLLLVIQTTCCCVRMDQQFSEGTSVFSFLHKEPKETTRDQSLRREKLDNWNPNPSWMASTTSSQNKQTNKQKVGQALVSIKIYFQFSVGHISSRPSHWPISDSSYQFVSRLGNACEQGLLLLHDWE